MTSLRIQSILRSGHRRDTPSVAVTTAPPIGATPQIACIVGKKVHASAVIRHRYQRLLRAVGRALVRAGLKYDMVMVAKPAILNLKKMDELQREVASLLT